MGTPSSSASEGRINLDRLFSGATTATFVIQLLALLILIGAIVGYLFVITGIWDLIKNNQDIIIFLLLIGGAVAFGIFMGFFGFFIRSHGRVKRFVLGDGIGKIVTDSRDGQIIIGLFAFSVVFFFMAGLYAIYLLWKYILTDIWIITGSIYPPIIFVTLAIIIMCLMVQVAARIVSRYAQGLVERISEDEKAK